MSETFEEQVEAGDRFTFGKNWSSFLATVDEGRVVEAEKSLRAMLAVDDLRDLTFLDVGSGSGLFSLAAARLGATVRSFDFDPMSVQCALELRERFAIPPATWTIEQGSALDEAYVRSLGTFDYVYSWGVLHHTGSMWRAIELVAGAVRPGGRLFLAIYNDQGPRSKAWLRVKQLYCSSPAGRAVVKGAFLPYFVLRGAAADLVRLRNPAARYRNYRESRGMSIYHDWVDWLGGLPFEVARPEEVLAFLIGRGFELTRLRTVGAAHGCNELVFRRARG